MIAIIDVVGNNLTSLHNALQRLQYPCVLTHNIEEIQRASHVILPGVGAALNAMRELQAHRLVPVLQQLQQPILGICLGMQLLFEHSAEGDVAGLGLLQGNVIELPSKTDCPLPHMGWNRLQWCQNSSLQTGLPAMPHVYFVHGFAVPVSEYTLASCQYSMHFSAIVQKNNIYGMQFHPEKSAEVGLHLLRNFLHVSNPCN